MTEREKCKHCGKFYKSECPWYCSKDCCRAAIPACDDLYAAVDEIEKDCGGCVY